MSERTRRTTVAVPLPGGGAATVAVRAAGPLTDEAALHLGRIVTGMMRAISEPGDALPGSYVDVVRELAAATDEAVRALQGRQHRVTADRLRTASSAARWAIRRLIADLSDRTTQMVANAQAVDDAQDDRLLAVVDRWDGRVREVCGPLVPDGRVPAELVVELLAELRGLAGVSPDGEVSL